MAETKKIPARGEDDASERLKMTEDWLRQEIRALRTVMIMLMQWGVTVLAAVELNLYYVRKDVTQHLMSLSKLASGHILPFARWGFGTLFLLMLAFIFVTYMNRLAKQHVGYRQQLIDMNPSFSHIKETHATSKRLGRVHVYLFLLFPLFDALVATFLCGRDLNGTV